MGKKGVYLFFIIASFLILIPIINAQAPIIQDVKLIEGYEIKYPQNGVLERNESYTFFFHLFNKSNGMPVGKTDANCSFHLYNETGEHTIEFGNIYNDGEHGVINEWEMIVTRGNFTKIGGYSYIVQCNSSGFGGYENVGFDVTETGFIIEEPEAIIYVVILIATFILFLGFLYPAIKLPYSNKTNPDGSITRITRAKYLKLLSVWFAYGFFMWFLQTLNGVSSSFITLTYLSNFITNIFTYSQGFSVGVTFLILIIMFVEVWKDIILSKTIKKYGKAFTDGRLQ